MLMLFEIRRVMGLLAVTRVLRDGGYQNQSRRCADGADGVE